MNKLQIVLALFVLLAGLALVHRSNNHGTILNARKQLNAEFVSTLKGKQALVFGGTSGIGEGIAKRLARDGVSVTIVGRNEVAGQRIVTDMEALSSSGSATTFNFIQADLTLLANARKAVEEFQEQVEQLHFVVFCQTKATMQGRTLTADGIDEKLALNYYSRVYISELLAPLMEKTAAATGVHGRIMTVLSAGAHSPYEHYEADPYLSEERYSLSAAADITSFYSDLWVDKASSLHPTIDYIHACPGFVDTNWGSDMPTPVLWLIRTIQKAPLLAKSPAECAELLLSPLANPSANQEFRRSSVGGNSHGLFYLSDEHGAPAPMTRLHTPQAVERVHEDTQKLLNAART